MCFWYDFRQNKENWRKGKPASEYIDYKDRAKFSRSKIFNMRDRGQNHSKIGTPFMDGPQESRTMNIGKPKRRKKEKHVLTV